MKSFLLKISVAAVILALAGGLVFALLIPQYYLPILPVTLVFFWVITVLVHAYQLNLAKKNIGRFTRSNMLVTFFKLIVYSVFAVIYIAIDSEHAIPFVICLMVLYMVFTFIEVSEITKISKNKKIL